MAALKRIAFGILVAFVVIQFIQPPRNRGSARHEEKLENVLPVPPEVQRLLAGACYDCHSNTTRYPWYTRIQPFSWILAGHVRRGKAELNFHEFGNYSRRRRISKLHAIANSVEDGTMPLRSYRWMHPGARLSEAEKKKIVDWARSTKDSLQSTK